MKPALTLAAAALALTCGACSSTLGDDVIHVDLSYGESSNWGPTDASGSAVVDPTSGQVDIEVHGLPQLTGEIYEGWLAGGDETATSTGRFVVDAAGDGSSTIRLGDISDTTFEQVVITVEPEPDGDPGPDSRHSIVGAL